MLQGIGKVLVVIISKGHWVWCVWIIGIPKIMWVLFVCFFLFVTKIQSDTFFCCHEGCIFHWWWRLTFCTFVCDLFVQVSFLSIYSCFAYLFVRDTSGWLFCLFAFVWIRSNISNTSKAVLLSRSVKIIKERRIFRSVQAIVGVLVID